MTKSFPSPMLQPPFDNRVRQAMRALPEIALPWLDLVVALGILVMLRLA